jgi:hypothetical protein
MHDSYLTHFRNCLRQWEFCVDTDVAAHRRVAACGSIVPVESKLTAV